MRPPIKDEFQHLPVSRQRKYQLRKQRDGLCTECGAPAQGSRCAKHLILARERQRMRKGTQRRYKGSQSYRLQAAKKLSLNKLLEGTKLKQSKAKPSAKLKAKPVAKLKAKSAAKFKAKPKAKAKPARRALKK
jgi:hypothetical protein